MSHSFKGLLKLLRSRACLELDTIINSFLSIMKNVSEYLVSQCIDGKSCYVPISVVYKVPLVLNYTATATI